MFYVEAVKFLASHELKQMVRSTMWTRNLIAKIFIGLLFALMALNFVSVGFYINKFLEQQYPDENPVSLFNNLLFYYILIDFLMRLLFQKGRALSVKPYLLHDVSKSTLANYVLIKHILSPFNFLPLLMIVPFGIISVIPNEGTAAAFGWFASLAGLLLLNCYLVGYIKYTVFQNLKLFIILLFTFSLIPLSNLMFSFDLSEFFQSGFSHFLLSPAGVMLPILSTSTIYLLLYRHLLRGFYLERISEDKSKIQKSGVFDVFGKLGQTGRYIELELKLLTRNKRSRTTIFFSASMLLLGFMFYPTMSEMGKYPLPRSSYEADLENYITSMGSGDDIKQIMFELNSDTVPEGANVYVSGSHQIFRNWNPRRVNLKKVDETKWVKTIPFFADTELSFKFTLGSWGSERLNGDGSIPEDSFLLVKNDTTVAVSAVMWKDPGEKIFPNIMIVYIGILIIGILMLSYGQFMFSWESGYFDFVLTSKIDLAAYFEAKYFLLVVSSILLYLICLIYGIFGMKIIIINSALFLYNIGVNSFVLFYLTLFSRKRFDLNQSIISTQGKGAGQYLTIVPVLLVPIILLIPFLVYDNFNYGLVFLALLGLAGLLFKKSILKFVLRQFHKHKYKMAAGFRIK